MPRTTKRAAPRRHRLTDGFIRSIILPHDKPKTYWDTVQRGLSLKVRPTGTMTFRLAYRHQGRLRWYTIDRYGAIGLKEARHVARKIRARADLGEDPQAEKVQARVGESFKHVHRAYVEKHARRKNKSWRQADKLMQTYVLPKLGGHKARDIKRRDLRRIFDDLTGNGRAALANQVLAAASATFSWAVEHEIVEANPVRGIKRNTGNGGSTRFLSNDEIRAVWPLFDDLGLLPSTVLKVILLTAQRPGEVCHMRCEHIDWDAALWAMPGEPGEPGAGWPGTKNGRDHEVPLTAPVLDLLRELDPAAHGHVFPSSKKGKCIAIPRVGPIWRQAGIERFRPHDLRATAATGMDALGIVRQHISLVLNHVEGGVTQSYVRHDKRQHKRSALQSWANELTAILDGKGQTDHRADVHELRQTAR